MAPRVHTKVTRQDWIDTSLAALDHVAIDELKVLSLATTLSVSRSSFYWYFENLDELHGELLSRWTGSTDAICERAARSEPTIVAACLGVFECWADWRLYDAKLDLAVREWGRRDAAIARRVEAADRERHDALVAMFARHGYEPTDATVRARLVYHSQVGYYAVGTDEPMSTRLEYLPYYLHAMTGVAATAEELDAFETMLHAVPPAR